MGASALENATLYRDAEPDVKAMNMTLGSLSGMGAGMTHSLAAAKRIPLLAKLLSGYTAKQMAMYGLKRYDKNLEMQLPLAQKNLETAQIANDTARIQSEAAKSWNPSDYARMGLAGAGLLGAGDLGYYLYKTLGPGKKKPAPRVTVQLPATRGTGRVSVEGEPDALHLSKRLYTALRQQTKHEVRDEAVEPQEKAAYVIALTRAPIEDRIRTLLEIV